MKIVKLYKEDCIPCKMLDDRLEEAGIAFEPVEVTVDNMEQYGVKSVPVLLFLDDNGNEIDRLLGLVSIGQVKRRLDDS